MKNLISLGYLALISAAFVKSAPVTLDSPHWLLIDSPPTSVFFLDESRAPESSSFLADSFSSLLSMIWSATNDAFLPVTQPVLDAIESRNLMAVQNAWYPESGLENDASFMQEALLQACAVQSADIVDFVLGRSGEATSSLVNARDGWCLRQAAKSGNVQLAQVLMKYGANVHVSEERPLILASQFGQTEMVQFLLANGAVASAQDSLALVAASVNGHADCVKLLLVSGANVHAQQEEALRLASWYGHLHCVQALVAAGADVQARNMEALRNAVENEHDEVVEVLLASSIGSFSADNSCIFGQFMQTMMKPLPLFLIFFLLAFGIFMANFYWDRISSQFTDYEEVVTHEMPPPYEAAVNSGSKITEVPPPYETKEPVKADASKLD